MTAHNDLHPVVRAWLHEVPALSDRDRVIGRVRVEVHVTGQRSSRRWSGTRMIPARLVAAIAVVAIGSGATFLAARQLQPQVAGLVPTPSLVVESVAPGVEHILGDGLRDFDRPEDTSMNKTAIGPDGTIWMLESDRLFKVGEPETISRDGVGRPEAPDGVPGFWDDIQVAHDGTLFTKSWPVRSFDGTSWQTEREGYLFPGQADGSIWAYGDGLIARWDDGRWTESVGIWGLGGRAVGSFGDDRRGDLDGSARPRPRGRRRLPVEAGARRRRHRGGRVRAGRSG